MWKRSEIIRLPNITVQLESAEVIYRSFVLVYQKSAQRQLPSSIHVLHGGDVLLYIYLHEFTRLLRSSSFCREEHWLSILVMLILYFEAKRDTYERMQRGTQS